MYIYTGCGRYFWNFFIVLLIYLKIYETRGTRIYREPHKLCLIDCYALWSIEYGPLRLSNDDQMYDDPQLSAGFNQLTCVDVVIKKLFRFKWRPGMSHQKVQSEKELLIPRSE